MKTCTKCGEIKPIDAFEVRRDRPSGYYSQCRQCRATRKGERRREVMRGEYGEEKRQQYQRTLSKFSKRRYQRRIESRLCTKCGKPLEPTRSKECKSCMDHRNKENKRRAIENNRCLRCYVPLAGITDNLTCPNCSQQKLYWRLV